MTTENLTKRELETIKIEKIVSRNPDRYEYKPIGEVVDEYGMYREIVTRSRSHVTVGILREPKSFSEWLMTEI